MSYNSCKRILVQKCEQIELLRNIFPFKISTHLRGALMLLENKSEIFIFFTPVNKSEKSLELTRKHDYSLNRNNHMAMNHMWHVWFYFMAISRLLQLLFQSLRSKLDSFRHRTSLDGLCVLGPAGSGGLWSRDGGEGGKHDSYRRGRVEADQGPCRSLESCFLGPCV